MNALRTALNVGSVALVAVAGWLLVRSVMGLVNPESLYAPEPVIAPAPSVVQTGQNRTYDFSSDPFSLAQPDVDTGPAEIVSDAPETSLNLTLKGSTTESSVIIDMPDGQQKNIRIGEEIMNGVTLQAIGKDFVTLDVNGETQKLTLERLKTGNQGGQPIIGRAPPPAEITPMSLPTQAEAEQLFSKVEIVPNFDVSSGEMKRNGFLVKPKAGTDLSTFGLQSGDVVTRIGPVLLDRNRVNIAELREMISTGAAQDIEVLRNGAPVTIRIGQ